MATVRQVIYVDSIMQGVFELLAEWRSEPGYIESSQPVMQVLGDVLEAAGLPDQAIWFLLGTRPEITVQPTLPCYYCGEPVTGVSYDHGGLHLVCNNHLAEGVRRQVLAEEVRRAAHGG